MGLFLMPQGLGRFFGVSRDEAALTAAPVPGKWSGSQLRAGGDRDGPAISSMMGPVRMQVAVADAGRGTLLCPSHQNHRPRAVPLPLRHQSCGCVLGGTARDRGDSHPQPPWQHGQGLAGIIVFLSSGSRRGTLLFMKHYFTRICLRGKESHSKGLQL